MLSRLGLQWAAILVVTGLAAAAPAADKPALQGQPGVLGGGVEKGPLEKVSKAVEAAKVEPVVIWMYNVQDLTLGRDYPYRSSVVPPTSVDPYAEGAYVTEGGAGGNAGLFGEAPAADTASLTSSMTPQVIMDLILRTVGPGSWSDEGGRGSIDNVGALLVITQTAENHKKIAELLDQLRTARPLVTIEARWVLLSDDQVAQIVPDDATKRTVPQEVTAAALKEAGATVIYRGLITCFDRQTVHLATGKGQAIMANMTPVIAEAAVGVEPKITKVLWGALLEVTPALAPDAKSVTLRLHSLITEMQQIRTKMISTSIPGEKTGSVIQTEVELPEFLLHTFRTALRMPVDKGILIGGMTAPKAADGKVLYLFLQVSASKPETK